MSPPVVHGSGGPTPTALLYAKRLRGGSSGPSSVESVKGKSANIPIPGHGDTRWQPCDEPGDGSTDPRKEFSFLVDGLAGPWKRIDRTEMVHAPRTAACFHAVGEIRVAQGKPRAAIPVWPVRTKNRSRSPGPRASGQWNNVAKGSRQNGGVTWEEALALRAGRGGPQVSMSLSAPASRSSRSGKLVYDGDWRRGVGPGCKQPP